MYASAQPLDFLARTKNPSFPNWKPVVYHPKFPDGHYLKKISKPHYNPVITRAESNRIRLKRCVALSLKRSLNLKSGWRTINPGTGFVRAGVLPPTFIVER
jgi:hypothetical protein